MQNQNIFDDLKFRIGYGVSGNSLGFGAYDARHIYTRAGTPIAGILNGATWYYPTLTGTNANPNLKWERTGMFNVGLDAEFLGGRLGGTIEYYIKRTKDLIHWYSVSGSRYPYGGTMPANVGEISNKGVELTINAIPVQGKEFQWNTTFTLSHNKNTVESISNGEFSVDYIREGNTDIGGVTNSTVQRIMEGCPIGQFYLPEWAGYNQDGVSVFNHYEDGVLVGTTTSPTEQDYRKAGSAQPKVTFSWSNTLTWKKWSLSAFFQGVGGNKIFNAKEAYYSNLTNVKNGKNGLQSLYDLVLADPTRINDTNSQYPSTRYLEKGSYLRLSALTLGYDFGRLGDWIQNLRLYATVNNVFTITGYDGCDPEISLGGLQPGIDWRQSTYPRTRTYLFGVNINF